MKHPPPEDWIPYLFGEATPGEQKQLSGHLEGCPECGDQIASWRRTLGRLNAWKLTPRSPRIGLSHLLPRWAGLAAAALLVLVLGAGLGRLLAPPHPDAEFLSAGIEARLAERLGPEVTRELREELRKAWRSEVDTVVERAALRAAGETSGLLEELVEALAKAREEDRRDMRSWIEDLLKRQAAQYLSLREDLETVAAFADEGIHQARQGILHLAVNGTAGSN